MFGDYPSNAPLWDNPLNLYVGPFANPNSHQATSAANRIMFMAFSVGRRVTVTNVRFPVVTSSGNVDVGIADEGFNRLTSTGSTPCPASGTVANLPLLTPVTLVPGVRYWALFAVDNATAIFATYGIGGSAGSLLLLLNANVAGRGATISFPIPDPVPAPTQGADRVFVTWFY